MNNKELYSYIVSSLDIMNQSLQLNERNTVRLFSYLYNNYTDSKEENSCIKTNISNNFSKLEKTIEEINTKNSNIILNISSSINEYKKNNDKKYLALLTKISKLEERILILENKKTIFDKFIDKIKEYINNINDILNQYIVIPSKKIYEYIYNKIHYKEILRQQEEQHRLEEEEKKRKEKEYKETIKNILKK